MRYRHTSFRDHRRLDHRKLSPQFGVYVLFSDGRALLVAEARTREDAVVLSRQVLIEPAQGIVDVYIEKRFPQQSAGGKRPRPHLPQPQRKRRRIEFASFGPKLCRPHDVDLV